MTIHTAPSSLLTYARVAGFTFLFYIAVGITGLALGDRPHVQDVISLFTSLSAVVLGVTLYMLTREQGPALALLALLCRVLEATQGQSAIFFAVGSTLFSWLLLRGRLIPVALAWLGVAASVLLVVVLPLQLAGLFGGSLNWSGAITWLTFLPMLVYEVTLAIWLLVKGVARPAANPVTSSAALL